MTDPGRELLDVLDERGIPTGRVKTRRQVHLDGDWHRAIHIWVVREERFVLLQRRAREKDLEPLKLDVTVGGHVRAGETFPESLREAEEELDLALKPGQLEYLGTAVSVRRYPDLPEPVVDRELQDVYVALVERPLNEYRLQLDEVDTLYEVPIDRAIELFRDGRHVAVAGYDSMKRRSDALLYEDDLPSQGRELHAQALARVGAYLRGEAASDLAARPFEAPA